MAMVGYVCLWVFMGVYGCLERVCGDVYGSLWVWELGVYGGMGRGGNSEK